MGGALEDREEHDSNDGDQHRDGPVDPPSASGALSRLFDQCLDNGLELVAVDGIARKGRTRRGGDGHDYLPNSVALVLLAPC